MLLVSRQFILTAILSGLMVACTTNSSQPTTPVVTTVILNTETPIPIVQAPTQQPEPVQTSAAPSRIVIWLPEPLLPLDNNPANELFTRQIEAFEASQDNIEVELRLKKATGLGSVMSTLRTASPVAPGVLPDLTLMRREDLLAAVQARLVFPLEGEISSAILGDLFPSALQLGQVDNELFGLPYMLEAQHLTYRPNEVPHRTLRFDDILNNQISFAMPVGQTNQINRILLTQYLDAGGVLPQGEEVVFDADALQITLGFYEQAVLNGLIDPAVLNYTSPADYQAALIAGTLDAGIITSTGYLNLLATDATLQFGSIPTASGQTVGKVDGWMWVITTSSANQQTLAISFLNWMLNATRQSEYSRTINMIPSRQNALQSWDNSPYIAFIQELLNNAVLPLSDSDGGTIARAVQNALIAILAGESTAEEAANNLLSRLPG